MSSKKGPLTIDTGDLTFCETSLPGVFLIKPVRHADSRGFFARTYCERTFATIGLCHTFHQCSVSFNYKAGTLRGMHFQIAPNQECKLVRCTMGAIFDVVVDLRPESPTCRKWVAHELNAENQASFYIPEGCAHGFITLRDNTEVFYHISGLYAPESARGIRWDDPALSITWPLEPVTMSDRDKLWDLL